MKNPQYNFIKKEHLCKAVRPSFTKFSTTKEQEIIKRSVHVPFNHSLDLQNTRIRFYSNTAVVERPKTPTVPKATKTSDTFKRMFIQKEASAQVSAASSTAIGNQAQRSATLLNDVNESEEEEVDIEGDDDKWDAEEDEEEELNGGNDNNEDEEEVELENEEENSGGYTSKIRNMAIAKLLDLKHTVEVINISIKDSNCNNRKSRIKSLLYRKVHSILLQENIDPISIELAKLSLSQILNYKKDDLFFDDGTNSLIDEALDRLMPYSISNNKDSLLSLIDELKYKEPSKNSTKYQILNAVETILSLWKSASPKSEYTYLRKFESLLEIILDDAELIMSDGESICASTRDCLRSSLKEVDEEMTKFGRRIDLLIKCSRLDTSAELCSIEFKKDDANNTDIIHQQSKNARVNVCILNSLNCFTNAFDNQVLSVDFVGTNGYMTQMFWCKEVIVTQKVCSLSIPTDVYDLGSLRNTLKYLYLWKKHLLVLSAKVIQSLHCNKRKYSLIETCEEDSSPRQCTPDMQLADVFMTPHRRTKK
ncbi:uncharacterized protein RHIMIDRAFT_245706 [Rhizopus microsporus ATCC 52813]|uniref:Uncharacterized protein n=1 Tax=Rhizopus microsporus ATCC 52813 TaxID=1340429 RepID=A0A2G4SNR0_RHIZD|nr:uncharacterized protein RHIMIDRAFT_245706 [Rhizopus microsporus ATCC 52813]PHZ10026.1 hypothetical protein RHIMIDRAFT_245706 [Rhizopus microsporus ATCC 52813]